MADSFLFYDLETWGTDPRKDRIAQFAGIRTDLQLNQQSEGLMLYCQLAADYLPSPEAALITGITPQRCQQKGLTENNFVAAIHQEFSEPGTCVLGYNNIRFDDEMLRHTFFRNYIEPYGREWQQGNSRWDLLDVVRAFYALRPDGIQWPLHDDGTPSFKLEDLTKANSIGHTHAHDALSDVQATIAIAQLLKQAQPKLFDYLYQYRLKSQLLLLIDVVNLTPLVHISGMFSAAQGCCSWVVPLAFHPTNKNAVICFDLQQDPQIIADLTIEQLKDLLYRKKSDLASDEIRPALKLVHLNKCPVLAHAKALSAERAAQLNIDRVKCLANLSKLKLLPNVSTKIIALYTDNAEYEQLTNPDYSLYQGFIVESDKQKMLAIRQACGEFDSDIPVFTDDRLNALLLRYKARNFPHLLTEHETKRWRSYCHDKLMFGFDNPNMTADDFMLSLENCAESCQADDHKRKILQAMYQYAQNNF